MIAQQQWDGQCGCRLILLTMGTRDLLTLIGTKFSPHQHCHRDYLDGAHQDIEFNVDIDIGIDTTKSGIEEYSYQ